MNYPEKALKKHPFANPERGTLQRRGQFWARRKKGGGIVHVDASRWLAHIGAKERGKHKAGA